MTLVTSSSLTSPRDKSMQSGASHVCSLEPKWDVNTSTQSINNATMCVNFLFLLDVKTSGILFHSYVQCRKPPNPSASLTRRCIQLISIRGRQSFVQLHIAGWMSHRRRTSGARREGRGIAQDVTEHLFKSTFLFFHILSHFFRLKIIGRLQLWPLNCARSRSREALRCVERRPFNWCSSHSSHWASTPESPSELGRWFTYTPASP